MTGANKVNSGFDRQPQDWYVEPDWCVHLLLDQEDFPGPIWDPCCGMGTIPKAIESRGMKCTGTDLVDRGYGYLGGQNFLQFSLKRVKPVGSIVMNPPYKQTIEFIEQALKFSNAKVAALVPLKFLASNARYGKFTEDWPLARVYVLSSRPSIPPGEVVASGEKATGGAIDFCWLVFEAGHFSPPAMHWLRKRDAKARKRARPHFKPAPEAALQVQRGPDNG